MGYWLEKLLDPERGGWSWLPRGTAKSPRKTARGGFDFVRWQGGGGDGVARYHGKLRTNSGVWVFMAEPMCYLFSHLFWCLGCFQMGLVPTVSGCFKEVAIHQKKEKLVKSEAKDPKKMTLFGDVLNFSALKGSATETPPPVLSRLFFEGKNNSRKPCWSSLYCRGFWRPLPRSNDPKPFSHGASHVEGNITFSQEWRTVLPKKSWGEKLDTRNHRFSSKPSIFFLVPWCPGGVDRLTAWTRPWFWWQTWHSFFCRNCLHLERQGNWVPEEMTREEVFFCFLGRSKRSASWLMTNVGWRFLTDFFQLV